MAAKFPTIEKKEKKAAEKPDKEIVDTQGFIKKGLDITVVSDNDLSDYFEFNGFQPEDTVEEMAKNLKGVDPKDKVLFTNAAVQFVAIRGTQASNKVRASMKQDGQAVLQATVTAFKIVPTPVDRKSVTFARIGNVMAISVQRVLVNDKGTRFAGRIVAEDFRPKGFCRAFCIPNFPSLIPQKAGIRKTLMNGFKIWVWKFSRTIRPTVAPTRAGAGGAMLPDDPTFTGQRVPDIDVNNKTFIDAMLQSKFFPEDVKLAALNEIMGLWLAADHVTPFEKAASVLYMPPVAAAVRKMLVEAKVPGLSADESKVSAAQLVTAIGVDKGRLLPRESLESIINDALAAGGEDNRDFYALVRSLASVADTPHTKPTS